MVDKTRDKCGAASRTESDKAREKALAEICEICGQEMERDPESGEFLCPYCYYSDEEE